WSSDVCSADLKNNGAKTPPLSTDSPRGRAGVSSTSRQQTPQLLPLPLSPEDRAAMELKLSQGYDALRARAKILLRETRLVLDLEGGNLQRPRTENSTIVQDLKAFTDGRMSAPVSVPPPNSVRAVARAMEANRGQAL